MLLFYSSSFDDDTSAGLENGDKKENVGDGANINNEMIFSLTPYDKK